MDNLTTDIEFNVSDFVAFINQTLEYAYPTATIRGELCNFKVSKGKWVYFDLKDEYSLVRFFGTVYQLPGPLEDGMMVLVRGTPRLHPRYGFSVSVTSIQPVGQGSIRRSAELLQASLAAEGLFDASRKRPIPFPPSRIGLITSKESAAFADFTKILNARWRGITIICADVQVQGELAPSQVVEAIESFNRASVPPDVLVVTRGGGSSEDLYAFNTEVVTRAIAASRVPTLVAIGHEIDVSLAELAADKQASTPSNAAELLVPDMKEALEQIKAYGERLHELALTDVHKAQQALMQQCVVLEESTRAILDTAAMQLSANAQLLSALNPIAIMKRGFAVVRRANGSLVRNVRDVARDDIVDIALKDGHIKAVID